MGANTFRSSKLCEGVLLVARFSENVVSCAPVPGVNREALPFEVGGSELLLLVSLTASGGAGVSPKGSGPPVVRDEISSVPSALLDTQGAPSPLSELQDREDSEPAQKRMRGGQSPRIPVPLVLSSSVLRQPVLENVLSLVII